MVASAEASGVAIHSLEHKMAHRIRRFHQILSTQKLIARYSIHLHVVIMHEYMRLRTAAPLAPREHRRREDSRHPPRRLRPVASWPIHQNHIPLHLVELIWQIIEPQLALREEKILHRSALVPHLLLHRRDQLRCLAQLGGVCHVVRLDLRVLFLNVGGVVPILVDEDGPPVEVERSPEEALRREAKDEEVARW